MSYSVDTSALLDAWVRCYPPDVFGTLWQRLDGLVQNGRLLVIDEVLRELERKDDELHKWVKARPAMVVPLDVSVQGRAAPIINRFPTLTQSGGVMRGAADPFVIALAADRGLTVVTAERSKPSKPRISDACRALGIRCATLVELFRVEGWQV